MSAKSTAAAKVPEKKIKTAFYVDKGSRGGGVLNLARLLSYSPELDVTLVHGKDLREGKLKNFDLLVMPGGSSKLQMESMGEKGVEELRSFVRNGGAELKQPDWIATLYSPKSGIEMEIFTTEGGLQMYTGNFMTAPNPFYGTIPQRANEAVALECNRIPDSPNQSAFPSPLLKAGEEYSQTTIYAFKKR